MKRKILIFFNVLLVIPSIIGNEDIKCREVDEAFNICIKDGVLVYVNQTKSKYTLSIDERELTSLSLRNKSLTFQPELFEGLDKIKHLVISSATLSLDENISVAMPTLRSIALESCKIVEIKRGAFVGFRRLTSVIIDNSNISNIDADTFDGVNKKLFLLQLRNNSISNLKPNTFKNFENLDYLQLDGNQLTDLEPGAFRGLQELGHLFLGRNHLTTIRKNVFNNLKQLHRLWLNNNQINSIEVGAFDGLKLSLLDLKCNQLKVIADGNFYGASISELKFACNYFLTIGDNAFNGASIKEVVYHDSYLFGYLYAWGLRDSPIELRITHCQCSDESDD